MRFVSYFFILVPTFVSATVYSPQDLETKAEIEGYGYKTANLMLLHDLLSSPKLHMSIKPFDVQVPDFVGVSSGEVQEMLEAQGVNVSQRWHQLVSSTIEQGIRDSLIAKRTLPQVFLDGSNQLSQDIAAAFVHLSKSALHHEPLAKFLQKARASHWHLMVRSTGKEDTDKLANAGGNLSVANLSPTERDVLVAIGQVVGSYFKERSLMQRIGAGDETIFDPPLTPALVQRMIGETLGGESNIEKIPVGCVLYTEETGGRQEEIHHFQCAFGHNEGVVQSLVPLDTYYVTKAGQLRSIVKDKDKRIVPVLENGVFGLEERANPAALRKRPALSKPAILAIFKVSDTIDDHYEKRMDIEMVYEPGTKTIYIVQARPLVIPEAGEGGPSYLVQASRFASAAVVQADIINPVDSAVLHIEDRAEVIVATTLELALQSYTSPNRNRQQVKAVLVNKQVDATSHAAAVFRGDSKAILQVKDLAKLQNWISQPKVNILVDPQRGLVVNLIGNEFVSKSMLDLFEARVLKRGWLNYPLPLRVSVDAHQPAYCLAPQLKMERIFDKVKCLINRFDDEVDNLGRLTEKAREQAHCNENGPGCLSSKIVASENLPKLEHLNTYAHELSKDINNSADEKNSLMTLFPKRFLESLLYQEPQANIQSSYSLKSVKEDLEEGQEFIKSTLEPMIASGQISQEVLKNPELFTFARLGANAALTDEVSKKWIIYVATVRNRGHFSEMVNELEALGMLPLWINSIFVQNSSNEHALYASFAESRDFLRQLGMFKAKLDAYDLGVWNDSTKFERNREQFKRDFLDYFLSDQFLNRKTKLEELAALALMGQFVDTFDLSIKALKSSQYSDPAQKVQHFKLSLEEYFQLLNRWAEAMPESFLAYHSYWGRDRYLSKVQELLNKNSRVEESNLLPSQGFSVAAAALGSATAFDRHVPKTLEDMFTLIHQSLNSVTGAMMKHALLEQLQLPSKFAKFYEALSNLQVQGTSSVLSGVSLSTRDLSFNFNIPLHNHSARVALLFDKTTQNVSLKMDFMGDRRMRWDRIRGYAELWSENHSLAMEDVSIGPQQLLYTIAHIEETAILEIVEFVQDTSFAANHNGRLPRGVRRALEEVLPQRIRKLSLEAQLVIYPYLLDDEKFYTGAIAAADKGILSSDSRTQESAIDLFEDLVIAGQAYDAAIAAANAIVEKESGNSDTLFNMIPLFEALIEKGHGYETAILAAKKGVSSSNATDRHYGRELFRTLFSKGQGIKEAEDLIRAGIVEAEELQAVLDEAVQKQ